MARYLKLYSVGGAFLKRCWIGYIGITCILLVSVIAIYLIGIKVEYFCGSLLKYNQPLVILSSVCLFLTFTSIKMSYTPIINLLAKSCIAVLLIHTSVAFNPCFSESFKYIFANTSGIITVLCWILAVVSIFFICAIFDQIRIYIENKILPKS